MGAGFRDGYLEEVQRRIGLTRRQAEVAYCVRGGLTNERTAEMLGIRPDTVKTHLRDIYKFLRPIEGGARGKDRRFPDPGRRAASERARAPPAGRPRRYGQLRMIWVVRRWTAGPWKAPTSSRSTSNRATRPISAWASRIASGSSLLPSVFATPARTTS